MNPSEHTAVMSRIDCDIKPCSKTGECSTSWCVDCVAIPIQGDQKKMSLNISEKRQSAAPNFRYWPS